MAENMKQKKNIKFVDFQGLQVLLASKQDILDWSYGEVTKPETINYRTLRPEKDGLFDERIFGPTKDWECYCGKYKRIRYKGVICDKCGVEVTLSRVRRERMGHITLAAPSAHVWFFKGASSPLSTLIDVSQKSLEAVIYYASHVVVTLDEQKKKDALAELNDSIEKRKANLEQSRKQEEAALTEDVETKIKEAKDRGNKEQQKLVEQELTLSLRQKLARLTERVEGELKKVDEIAAVLSTLLKNLHVGSVISEEEYYKVLEYEIPEFFTIKTGAEALKELLEKMDFDEEIVRLRGELEKATSQRYLKLIKRLRLMESMKKAGIKPVSLLLEVLPVLPSDLRPMVQLAGGRFATSDLNDLYRRVINRNNRLKHLIGLGAPEIILRNEKRMLQEAVDALIDEPQRSSQTLTNPLRSLSELLRGKQGRFRGNLLGKRVDYSGRSVIVVGPDLKLNQCGLPKDMALEMFKPFVLREVIVRGYAPNIKSAKRFIERRPPEVFDILEEITKNHPVILNRAPTLHKLSMQAFYPKLIEGSAISLHPCVTSGFNADFDGDQMAVHIPLSKKAQQEALDLMMPQNNLLKPADSSPANIPAKEMAIGVYYITTIDENLRKEELPAFANAHEAILAQDTKKIGLREPVMVRLEKNGELVETTVGRIRFNEVLLEGMSYLNEAVDAGRIKKLVTEALQKYTNNEVAVLIDNIKEIGFYGATISGVSLSVFDNTMIANKGEMINGAEKQVEEIISQYEQGLITIDERKRLVNDVWIAMTEKIADASMSNLKQDNMVLFTIKSGGSRGGREQLKQVLGMRGLIQDPTGKIVELPIKSNFREGLSIFEYIASARGSRKGLADTALKTAQAGYLTRRLVDVSHDVLITEDDCGTTEGVVVKIEAERTASLEDRITGRTSLEKIVDADKKVLVHPGEEISPEMAKKIAKTGVTEVAVRSPLTCKLAKGVCATCYGWDFSTRTRVKSGTPVGVVAAQSIGEPGTQLTMRTKHFGGILKADVTQGLPRIEELFEMRTPKNYSAVSQITGKVKIEQVDEGYKITVTNHKVEPIDVQEYFVPLASELAVKDGDEINAGQPFATGYLDPKEVLRVSGISTTQKYVMDEIQKVYEAQGIAINDKHFEVILRKMGDKIIIESVGDTSFVPGDFVTRARFDNVNAEVLAQGAMPATGRQVLLGITKSALFSDSWLSAASFQETTHVLTEAALQGREDNLNGLKENVIIGRLIPVGGNETPEEVVIS